MVFTIMRPFQAMRDRRVGGILLLRATNRALPFKFNIASAQVLHPVGTSSTESAGGYSLKGARWQISE
jgi:hypothetical protein